MPYHRIAYHISRKAFDQSDATITVLQDGTLRFDSPFDRGLVLALKAEIPVTDRCPVYTNNKFDYWAVAPQHAETLADLAEQFDMGRPKVPQVKAQATTSIKLLSLMYLGAAKDRADGSQSSFGWVDGGWSAIFPIDVLKDWFAVDHDTPAAAFTLYAILGIKAKATDPEIKKAYRRTAKQWHPDVCSDPGAEEQFKRINEAYQVLSKPLQRRKYDAGLILERSITEAPLYGASRIFAAINQMAPDPVWRPPLHCGMVLAQGQERLGRFVVSEILQWEDHTNAAGQTLVTSWQYGADTFTERWV